MSYAAPIIAGQEVRGEFDFESYSEAGFTWDPSRNRWVDLSKKAGLGAVGTTVYAQHPSTEVLCLSYKLPLIWWNPRTQAWCYGGQKRRWRPGLPAPQELFDFLAGGGVLEAHNVFFERSIWAFVCVTKYGWPELEPFVHQLRCSMAKARVNALPGGLMDLSNVLDLPTPKDARGKALLDKFSMPRNPTAKDPRRRVLPVYEHPGAPPPPPAEGKGQSEAKKAHRAAMRAWELACEDHRDTLALMDYCDTDIDAEEGASERMYPMTEAERLFWWVDQEINWRGVAVDRQAIEDCTAILGQVLERYGQEFRQITGLEVTQLAALKTWLAERGVVTESLDQEAVEGLLKWKPSPGQAPMAPHVRRALEVRELTGSASVKKLFAMAKRCPADDRLRNLIIHHGARTGRPTGEGPQPLNLPKPGPDLTWCDQPACHRPFKQESVLCPWCFAKAPGKKWQSEWGERPKGLPDWVGLPADYALEVMRARDMGLVEIFFGNALLTISGCIRGLFVAGPGMELIASDYSAIEAVVTAVLAGEQWRIDAFKAKTDIYVASASKITGKSVEWYQDYHLQNGHKHPDRQKIGKVAELGLGFGGWVNAWLAFDDSGTFSEDEIRRLILRWREESPAIVEFWGGQFRNTRWVEGRRVGDWEPYGVEGHAILALQHPGVIFDFKGMKFQARDGHLFIRLLSGRELTYRDARLVPSQRKGAVDGEQAIIYWTWNSNPKYGAPGWVAMNTFGGRLTENIVQATAHDILRHAILNLRAAGYPTVLHIYDEVVVEVPLGLGSLEEVERIMMLMPDWAQGWPIWASGGWRGRRYRKA